MMQMNILEEPEKSLAVPRRSLSTCVLPLRNLRRFKSLNLSAVLALERKELFLHSIEFLHHSAH